MESQTSSLTQLEAQLRVIDRAIEIAASDPNIGKRQKVESKPKQQKPSRRPPPPSSSSSFQHSNNAPLLASHSLPHLAGTVSNITTDKSFKIEVHSAQLTICADCLEEIEIKDIKRHQQEQCPNKIISCPNIGCHASLHAVALKWHLQEECLIAKHRLELMQRADERLKQQELEEKQRQEEETQRTKAALLITHAQQSLSQQTTTQTTLKDVNIYPAARICVQCGEGVIDSQLAYHMRAVCHYRLLSCPHRNFGCSAPIDSIPLALLNEHLRNDCQAEKNRELLIARSKSRYMKVTCITCGCKLPLYELKRHESELCSNRMVPCRNSHLGCRVMVPLLERGLHEHVPFRCADNNSNESADMDRYCVNFPGFGTHMAINETDISPPWTTEFWVYRSSTINSLKQALFIALTQVTSYELAFVQEFSLHRSVMTLVTELKTEPKTQKQKTNEYLSTLTKQEKKEYLRSQAEHKVELVNTLTSLIPVYSEGMLSFLKTWQSLAIQVELALTTLRELKKASADSPAKEVQEGFGFEGTVPPGDVAVKKNDEHTTFAPPPLATTAATASAAVAEDEGSVRGDNSLSSQVAEEEDRDEEISATEKITLAIEADYTKGLQPLFLDHSRSFIARFMALMVKYPHPDDTAAPPPPVAAIDTETAAADQQIEQTDSAVAAENTAKGEDNFLGVDSLDAFLDSIQLSAVRGQDELLLVVGQSWLGLGKAKRIVRRWLRDPAGYGHNSQLSADSRGHTPPPPPPPAAAADKGHHHDEQRRSTEQEYEHDSASHHDNKTHSQHATTTTDNDNDNENHITTTHHQPVAADTNKHNNHSSSELLTMTIDECHALLECFARCLKADFDHLQSLRIQAGLLVPTKHSGKDGKGSQKESRADSGTHTPTTQLETANNNEAKDVEEKETKEQKKERLQQRKEKEKQRRELRKLKRHEQGETADSDGVVSITQFNINNNNNNNNSRPNTPSQGKLITRSTELLKSGCGAEILTDSTSTSSSITRAKVVTCLFSGLTILTMTFEFSFEEVINHDKRDEFRDHHYELLLSKHDWLKLTAMSGQLGVICPPHLHDTQNTQSLGSVVALFNTKLPRNKWSHLALTCQIKPSKRLTVYLDGALVGGHKDISPALPMCSLGGSPYTMSTFIGALLDARYWSMLRSQGVISRDMHRLITLKNSNTSHNSNQNTDADNNESSEDAGLIAWWTFDDGPSPTSPMLVMDVTRQRFKTKVVRSILFNPLKDVCEEERYPIPPEALPLFPKQWQTLLYQLQQHSHHHHKQLLQPAEEAEHAAAVVHYQELALAVEKQRHDRAKPCWLYATTLPIIKPTPTTVHTLAVSDRNDTKKKIKKSKQQLRIEAERLRLKQEKIKKDQMLLNAANHNRGKHNKHKQGEAAPPKLPYYLFLDGPNHASSTLPVPSFRDQNLCSFELRRHRLARLGRDLYSLTACPLNCSVKVIRKMNVKHHVRFICEKRFVRCRFDYCSGLFQECDRMRHEREDCIVTYTREQWMVLAKKHGEVMACPQCGEAIKSRDMVRHMNSRCVHRMVYCPRIGCSYYYQAGSAGKGQQQQQQTEDDRGKKLSWHLLDRHLKQDCDSPLAVKRELFISRARERHPYARPWGITVPYCLMKDEDGQLVAVNDDDDNEDDDEDQNGNDDGVEEADGEQHQEEEEETDVLLDI